MDTSWASLVAQRIKKSACKAVDWGSVPGLGRSAGEGNGNPLQYSCLENSMDRGIWWATVHAVAEPDTTEQLTHTHGHLLFRSVGLEMTSALEKCPGVGLGKRIQNMADFQEANFKSYISLTVLIYIPENKDFLQSRNKCWKSCGFFFLAIMSSSQFLICLVVFRASKGFRGVTSEFPEPGRVQYSAQLQCSGMLPLNPACPVVGRSKFQCPSQLAQCSAGTASHENETKTPAVFSSNRTCRNWTQDQQCVDKCLNWVTVTPSSLGFPGKEPACQCRRENRPGLIPGSGRSPGGRHGNPLQNFAWEFHGERSLVGYSP